MVAVKFIETEKSTTLAAIKYESFQHVLIPDFKPNKHSVFLRQSFEDHEGSLWKVDSLEIEDLSVNISVTQLCSPKSLGLFAQEQSKKPATILRTGQFQLVEVEFGCQQDRLDANNERMRNELNPLALMPGELHKKRPCIVVGCDDDKVQIIPLTSKGCDTNPKQLAISNASFNGLSKRYTEKSSHALISMMQTVSAFRVYPMKNASGRYDHRYQSSKLDRADKAALQEKLGKLYASSTMHNLQNEQKRSLQLSQEKARLLDTLEKSKQSQTQLSLEHASLTSTLEQLAEFFDISWSSHEELQKLLLAEIRN